MTSTLPGELTDTAASTCVGVAIVDDHQLLRQSVASWLATEGDGIEVTASVRTVDELRRSPGWGAPVVLLDLVLADGSTVEGNVAALGIAGSSVVVVSAHAEPLMVRRALQAGATSYVPKSASAEELLAAIRATAAGAAFMTQELATALLEPDAAIRPKLSGQEQRTLIMYAGGMPLKAVARRLEVTEGCVKSYVDRIRDKYRKAGREAPTKVDLYRVAIQDGYL